MKQLFLVKSRVAANRKPTIRICVSNASAEKKRNELMETLPEEAKSLVEVDSITVKDYDPNKTSAYLIWDRTENGLAKNKGLSTICFDFASAEMSIKRLRLNLPPHSHKLISAEMAPVEA